MKDECNNRHSISESNTPSYSTNIVYLLTSVLLINIFVIGLAFYFVNESRYETEQMAKATTENLSQVLVQSIHGSIDQINLILLTVTDEIEKQLNSNVIEKLPLEPFLSRERKRLPEINRILVSNSQGELVLGIDGARPHRKSVADRDYFILLRDDPNAKLVIGKPIAGVVDGEWIQIFARRINSPDGSFAGVVTGSIRLEYFRKLFSSITVGKHGSITLRDKDLAILARYPDNQMSGYSVGQKIVSKSLHELIKSGKSSATYKATNPVDSIERTITFHKVSDYPLYVTVGLATNDYISVWSREAMWVSGLVLIFTLLTCFASWLLICKFKREKQSEEALLLAHEKLEQKVAERTLSLETALRELESFSYSVSHDLRTPLTHIDSFITIMSEDFRDLLPPQAISLVDRTLAESRRMGKLIDALLELARVSRTQITKKPVNLSELAIRVCDGLREGDPDRSVEIVIGDGLIVQGDKSLLIQLMVNLLGNAWKYTSETPTAHIEFGKEVVAGQDIFYISDNGVGFDMAYSDKLFREFQRLHGSEYEGTGIGLATVKRIVDRHRGSVWAVSKPNEGATFYFTLS
jgi:signal transduction histidine kinase